MERMTVDEQRVIDLRASAASTYPEAAEPIPGSLLKQDDHVLWLGFARCVVLWGASAPDVFSAWSPQDIDDCLVELPVGVAGEYISDRAPADPSEEPLPIFPEVGQMQQGESDDAERQMGGKRRTHHHATLQEQRDAVAKVLAQLPDADKQRATERIRKARPELVAQDIGDHRHNAVPPSASGAKGDRD